MLFLKAFEIRIRECIDGILVKGRDKLDDESETILEKLERRLEKIDKYLYNIIEDNLTKIVNGKYKLSESNSPVRYDNKSIIQNKDFLEDFNIILYGNTKKEIEEKIRERINKDKSRKKYDNKRSNFDKNFTFFYDKLSEKSFDSVKIPAYCDVLCNDCQVVVLISDKRDKSIQIFNSLNATGQPLTDADIISATLYGNSEDKDAFGLTWHKLYNAAEQLKDRNDLAINEILNQYMYIVRAREGKQDNPPAMRKYFIDDNKNLLQDPNEFASNLNRLVEIWSDENEFDYAGLNDEEKIAKKKLFTLKRLLLQLNGNFKYFYASYMYTHKDTDYVEKVKFAEALLKLFTVLDITRGSYSHAVKGFLMNLNVNIVKERWSTEKIVESLNQKTSELILKNDIEKILSEENASKGTVYLNEYLFADENGGLFDIPDEKIEIEHIMANSGKDKSEIYKNSGLNEDTVVDYVDKLGNKILLEKKINGSIGKKWFYEKKKNNNKSYDQSQFYIARSLSEKYGDDEDKKYWTKDDITYATKKSAERIARYLKS